MKDEPNIPDEIKRMVAAGKVERPWIENTEANPFWEQKDRIEVKYRGGNTEVFILPGSARGLSQSITHWRSAAIQAAPRIRIGGTRKPEIPKPKIMPTVYKGGIIKTEWFRRFTKMDRLKILFGANFIVGIGIACEHNAGKYQPLIVGEVTKHTSAENHMREVIENMLVDKDSPVNKIAEI